VILGASFDTPADNKAFADEQCFGFRLLSDVDRQVGVAYEVVRNPLEQYAEFPLRIAYLIDPDSTIRRSYQVSDVDGFADAAMSDLETLQAK
jgi:peroxiredoxin Q/BCP